MISFYPGPSRVYDEVPRYVRKAHKKGILSLNHRSEEFMSLAKKTVGLLRDRLHIPKTYTVYFTGSATECWEIIAQSLVREGSTHIFNGAFGEKWFDYTKRIRPRARGLAFDREREPDFTDPGLQASEMICLTQNETSNGTQVGHPILKAVKKNNPHALVAVDATSSMAGIHLDFDSADIWFASVQKCFGLPAGLGILVCSPAAVKRAKELNERDHCNSLVFMHEMMEKWQTPYTPNVLGIYLLKKVLKEREDIGITDQIISNRQEEWTGFFKNASRLRMLIQNPHVRSKTVIAVSGEPQHLALVKSDARKKGILLGEGYGTLKKESIRIANFPALKKKEIKNLMKFLISYC